MQSTNLMRVFESTGNLIRIREEIKKLDLNRLFGFRICDFKENKILFKDIPNENIKRSPEGTPIGIVNSSQGKEVEAEIIFSEEKYRLDKLAITQFNENGQSIKTEEFGFREDTKTKVVDWYSCMTCKDKIDINFIRTPDGEEMSIYNYQKLARDRKPCYKLEGIFVQGENDFPLLTSLKKDRQEILNGQITESEAIEIYRLVHKLYLREVCEIEMVH